MIPSLQIKGLNAVKRLAKIGHIFGKVMLSIHLWIGSGGSNLPVATRILKFLVTTHDFCWASTKPHAWTFILVSEISTWWHSPDLTMPQWPRASTNDPPSSSDTVNSASPPPLLSPSARPLRRTTSSVTNAALFHLGDRFCSTLDPSRRDSLISLQTDMQFSLFHLR